jgi:hypothetical protein
MAMTSLESKTFVINPRSKRLVSISGEIRVHDYFNASFNTSDVINRREPGLTTFRSWNSKGAQFSVNNPTSRVIRGILNVVVVSNGARQFELIEEEEREMTEKELELLTSLDGTSIE